MDTKKISVAISITLAVLLLVAVIMLIITSMACQKAQKMCEDEWHTYAENSTAFLPYSDSFGNPTSVKPLELCKEVK